MNLETQQKTCAWDHHDQLMEYIWAPNLATKIGISTCCQSFNPTPDKDIINQQTGAFQTIITGEQMTIPATSSTSRIASLTHPGTLLHRPFWGTESLPLYNMYIGKHDMVTMRRSGYPRHSRVKKQVCWAEQRWCSLHRPKSWWSW